MPEGPEIRYLFEKTVKPAFEGKVLNSIEGLSLKYLDSLWKTKERKFNRLLPSKINSVNRIGKYIWLELENNMVIGFSFGLRGYITNKQSTEYQRVRFNLKGRKTPVYYDDMMNYGSILLMTKKENDRKTSLFGVDIYSANYNNFAEKLLSPTYRDKQIVIGLMSQKVIAGIGNYIKNESLYSAKISPFCKPSQLSSQKLRKLFTSIVSVAEKFYNAIKNDIDYDSLFRVYQRENDIYGNNVIATKTDDGRTSYWVKSIQKC